MDSIKNNNQASFCTYDSGYKKEGQWQLTIKSVIVFGKIEIIDNRDIIVDVMKRMSHKFTDDEDYIEREIRNFADKTLLLELTPEHVCGKNVEES